MARLYYVIGPSGSGKDSVLQFLRAQLPPQWPLLFAHRYITRSADAGGENHVALSAAEFALRQDHGLFCMHWHSNALSYGVGVEVRDWMSRGLSVVVNGSREYLAQADALMPNLVPVCLTVEPEVLRQRLQQRGRESAEQIESRLERARLFTVDHPRAFHLNNDGPLTETGERLLQRIALDLETA